MRRRAEVRYGYLTEPGEKDKPGFGRQAVGDRNPECLKMLKALCQTFI
jgi:hypothetical protein